MLNNVLPNEDQVRDLRVVTCCYSASRHLGVTCCNNLYHL